MINSTGGTTWADYGTNINLSDGDTLTIDASAGSPGLATGINILANANVTINGNVNTITNLYILESGGDTAAHNININNLKYTAPAGQYGYGQAKGVLRLTGSNVINSNGTEDAFYAMNAVTIAGSGTLTINGGAVRAMSIGGGGLDIQGSAKVTVNSSGTSTTIGIGSLSNSMNVANGASLTATASSGASAISFSGSNSTLVCNGTITATNTNTGCFAVVGSNIIISGSGTINATGSGPGISVTNTISINGTKVNSTATGNYYGIDSTDLVLTGNAELKAISNGTWGVGLGCSIKMSPGTTATLTNGSPSTETHSFAMSAAGNNWVLSGSASFVAPSTATSNPANISVANGSTGTIKLVAPTSTPPGITGQTTMTLTEGYAATSTTAYTLTGNPAPNVSKTSGDPKITWSGGKLNIATGLTAGSYPVVLTASNGTLPNATLTFTLTVNPAGGGTTPPGINGQTTMTLTEGYAATSTTAYTLTGNPAPNVTKTSGDPKITWSGGKLNIATGLAAGSYPVVLTASNGTPPNATLTFTLTVNASGGGTTPTVTAVKVAPATADVQKGSTRTFSATVEGTNSPSQAVTWTMTGNSDANTNISTAGVLTVAAGETASTLTVKATSNADSTKSGTATVTVKAASGGTDGKDGTDDSGGSDNTLMYVAVGAVVLIAIVGVAYFLFIRKP